MVHNFLRFYPQFLSRESWRVKDIKIADKIELNGAVHAFGAVVFFKLPFKQKCFRLRGCLKFS